MNKNSPRHIDMLQGSLWNKILYFALPLAATGILQQLFHAADLAVIGHYADTNAVAAVGGNAHLIGLLLNFFIGISVGVNVVIANAIGRKDEDTVHSAVHSALPFSVLCGFFVTILFELGAVRILSWMQVPQDAFALTTLYMRIYMLGAPAIFLYNFESAVYRSIGNTRTPMLVLILSGLLNLLLNIFLVAVMGRSVDGVALATVISNVFAALALAGGLMRADDPVRLKLRSLRMNRKILSEILGIGIPSGLQSVSFKIANVLIQSSVNSLGTAAMAASGIAMQLEMIPSNFLSSFSQACTSFVGQNYGAKQYNRCAKSFVLCLLENFLFTMTAMSLMTVFCRPLFRIFDKSPDVISAGSTIFFWYCIAYAFYMISDCISGYLRGCGISVVPALISLVSISALRIVWVYTVFTRHHTLSSLMVSYPVSNAIAALCVSIYAVSSRKRVRP